MKKALKYCCDGYVGFWLNSEHGGGIFSDSGIGKIWLIVLACLPGVAMITAAERGSTDGALLGDQASIGDERRPLRSGIEDAGASYLAKRRFDLHSHVWAVERIDALERIIDQAAGCKRVGRINFD